MLYDVSDQHYNTCFTYLGSLATSIVDSSTFLAGASGGCYALIGAHFAIVIMVCNT